MQLGIQTRAAGAVVLAVVQRANRDLQLVGRGAGFLDVEDNGASGQGTVHVDLVVGALDQVVSRAVDLDAVVGFLIAGIEVVVEHAFRPGGGAAGDLQAAGIQSADTDGTIGDQIPDFLEGSIVLLVVVCVMGRAHGLIDTDAVQIQLGGLGADNLIILIEDESGHTGQLHHVLAQRQIVDTDDGNLIDDFRAAVVAVVKLGVGHGNGDEGSGGHHSRQLDGGHVCGGNGSGGLIAHGQVIGKCLQLAAFLVILERARAQIGDHGVALSGQLVGLNSLQIILCCFFIRLACAFVGSEGIERAVLCHSERIQLQVVSRLGCLGRGKCLIVSSLSCILGIQRILISCVGFIVGSLRSSVSRCIILTGSLQGFICRIGNCLGRFQGSIGFVQLGLSLRKRLHICVVEIVGSLGLVVGSFCFRVKRHGRAILVHRAIIGCIGCIIGSKHIVVAHNLCHVGFRRGQIVSVGIGAVITLLVDPSLDAGGVEGIGTADDLEAGAGEGEGANQGLIHNFDFGHGFAAVQVIFRALIHRILTIGLVGIDALGQLTGTVAMVGKAVGTGSILVIIVDGVEGILVVNHRCGDHGNLLVHLGFGMDVDAGRIGIRRQNAGLGADSMDRNSQPHIVGLIHEVLRSKGQAGRAAFGAIGHVRRIPTGGVAVAISHSHRGIVDRNPGFHTGSDGQVNGLVISDVGVSVVDDDHAHVGGNTFVGIPAELAGSHKLAGPGHLIVGHTFVPVVDINVLIPAAGDAGMNHVGTVGILNLGIVVGSCGAILIFHGITDGVGNLNPGFLTGVNRQVAGLLIGAVVDQDVGYVTVNGQNVIAVLVNDVFAGGFVLAHFYAGIHSGLTVIVPVMQINLVPGLRCLDMDGNFLDNRRDVGSMTLVFAHRHGFLINRNMGLQAGGNRQVNSLVRVVGGITVADDNVVRIGRDIYLKLTGTFHGSHFRTGEVRSLSAVIVPVVQVSRAPVAVIGNRNPDGHGAHTGQGILAGDGIVSDDLALFRNCQVDLIDTIGCDNGIAVLQILTLEGNPAVVGIGGNRGIQIGGLGAGNAHHSGADGTVPSEQVVILEQLTVQIQSFRGQAVVQNVHAVLHIGNVDLTADDGVFAFSDFLSVHTAGGVVLAGTGLQIQQQIEGVDTRLVVIDQVTGIATCIGEFGVVAKVSVGSAVLIAKLIVDIAQIIGFAEELVIQVQLGAGGGGFHLTLLQQVAHLHEDVVAGPLIVNGEAGGINQMVTVGFQGLVTHGFRLDSGGCGQVDGVMQHTGLNLILSEQVIDAADNNGCVHPQAGTGVGDFRVIEALLRAFRIHHFQQVLQGRLASVIPCLQGYWYIDVRSVASITSEGYIQVFGL